FIFSLCFYLFLFFFFFFFFLFFFLFFFFFFFNDTATTEIYTLSLHDALPISATSSRRRPGVRRRPPPAGIPACSGEIWARRLIRKSRRSARRRVAVSVAAAVTMALFPPRGRWLSCSATVPPSAGDW